MDGIYISSALQIPALWLSRQYGDKPCLSPYWRESHINDKNIYLIGMMGCGKSTVAPILAPRLEYNFIDTDRKIVALNNLTTHEIFKTMGEPKFRELETEALKEVATNSRQIVATGGGIAIEPTNWSYLHQGLTIWLDPSIDILVERLKHDESRPILAGGNDLRANLEQILVRRRHLYAQAKIHLLISQNLTPNKIAELILKELKTVILDDNYDI